MEADFKTESESKTSAIKSLQNFLKKRILPMTKNGR